MKKLSIEQMETVRGGEMSAGCALSIAALGLGAIAITGLSGGIGFYGALAMIEVGVSSAAFMESCGPSDFS